MKIFEQQEFRSVYDQDSGKVFSDMEFRKCRFVSCAISITVNPELRSTVRNVRIMNCEHVSGNLGPAIVEDVLADGFKTNGLFQTWGAVFKHVTWRGMIGRVMLSPAVAPGRATKAQQEAFDNANATYYSEVDWALDLSEAEVEEIDIRGIPGRLIRRDPMTQVLITRANAARGEWRRLNLSKTYWATCLQEFLKDGEPALVLVAPKRNKKFRDLLDGLKMLRDSGVAEPD